MADVLNDQQRERAVEAMKEYLGAPPLENGKTPAEDEADYDKKRVHLIEGELKPLINRYLSGAIALGDFKSKIDSINKRKPYWGFKGIKGQMFFNMIVNISDDLDELDQELKTAIVRPDNEQIASSRIKTFYSYVNRLREQWIDAGNAKHGAPKIGSILFFLSYFWQVQEREVWPVYYTNTVNILKDLNIWYESGNMPEDYLCFKKVHEELMKLFSEKIGRLFSFYDVEHVFWFKGGNPYSTLIEPENETRAITHSPASLSASEQDQLPEIYVPPIVSILPEMARHSEKLVEAAKRSGTILERAFEKYIDAAFTMLGYESQLLGQGKGRVPDGRSISYDDGYALIWDAKVRAKGYSMGTDDRAIREYIMSQSRELKKKQSLRNIYYVIVSSSFADDFEETIRSIKMETDINEVIMMEAEALVAIVDAKLRAPLEITLGSDGIQRLFTSSGVLSAKTVRELLS